MDYVICIPSYKRANLCKDKTLSTLMEHNIPKSKIYVFVANQKEYADYEKVIEHKLIVGKKGLVQQREFISNYFKTGQRIVFFDDDVEKIDLSLSPLFKNKSLDYFLKYAFKECKKRQSFIWGVYPVFNPFFREPRPEITDNLNYIVGAFYGIINRPDLKELKLVITKKNGQKEDVERTLKYFIYDGIVLRFNKIGFVTKYYGKHGGLGTFETRLKPMLLASQKLQKKYPQYGTIVTRKTGMTEFKLRKTAKLTI
ncbi:MAG: hypothetical protein ACO3HJ_04295 [Methylophilaceae bacterium]